MILKKLIDTYQKRDRKTKTVKIRLSAIYRSISIHQDIVIFKSLVTDYLFSFVLFNRFNQYDQHVKFDRYVQYETCTSHKPRIESK